MHNSVCISGCIWHHFKIWYLTFDPSKIFIQYFLYINIMSWWSEGITIIGRIKSRDVQSNGQIFLSNRVLHIFRTTAKSYRGQSLFASVLKFMYRVVKSTKICSVPRIFKTKCKLFMCAKGKHKTKRNNSPCWPQNLAEQSSGNNLLNSRI